MSRGSVTVLSSELCGYRGMLWTLSKARKEAKCWLRGSNIAVGEMCWRPLGNSCERYRRISQLGMSDAKPAATK